METRKEGPELFRLQMCVLGTAGASPLSDKNLCQALFAWIYFTFVGSFILRRPWPALTWSVAHVRSTCAEYTNGPVQVKLDLGFCLCDRPWKMEQCIYHFVSNYYTIYIIIHTYTIRQIWVSLLTIELNVHSSSSSN